MQTQMFILEMDAMVVEKDIIVPSALSPMSHSMVAVGTGNQRDASKHALQDTFCWGKTPI